MTRNNPRDRDTSQTELHLDLVGTCELWHLPGNGDAYATIAIDGHCENWPVRSREFQRWLSRSYFLETSRAPSSRSMTDAICTIEGRAMHDGLEHCVHVRVAGDDSRVYLDLCDSQWRVIEIDSHGWRLVDNPPVHFRRTKGMQALPVPTPNGRLKRLRELANVSDGDWPLLAAWLVGALRPHGPYPVLCLHGEQGSSKSTTARMLRRLIDPSVADIRCAPRDERDLAIAAFNGWVIALDNLSYMSSNFSDSLCRLSTGGGFTTRALFTNSDELIIDVQRPTIVTGIEDVATRGDLLDRCLVVNLPRIPDTERRAESAIWKQYGVEQAGMLGSLCDSVAHAIRALPSTRLARIPRMADFAIWSTAAEPALGIPLGGIMESYDSTRASVLDSALGNETIVPYLMQLVGGSHWAGMSRELLHDLDDLAPEHVRKRKDWPKTPGALSGKVTRLAPMLREVGIVVERDRTGRGRETRKIIRLFREEASQKSDNIGNSDNTSLLQEAKNSNVADVADVADDLQPSLHLVGSADRGRPDPSEVVEWL